MRWKSNQNITPTFIEFGKKIYFGRVPYNNCCKKNRYHTEKLIHNDNVFTIFRKVRLVQKKNCIIKGTKTTLELALFTKKSLNSGAKKEGCTVF